MSKQTPVIDKDGKLMQFMIKTDGISFRCTCTCNVFHKPDKNNLKLLECNSCRIRYIGE